MFRALSTIGRGSLTSFWTLFWVLVCLHQLYYGWFLIRSSFVPYVMDGNETFSVWWHAHNLYTFSFWKSFGLTDESYGLTEASHPYFHTHQGNMPRLFGFLIYVLGARTVEAQVLVTTLVIGNLTLFFCYASIAKIARPAVAFIFCLFLFSDYLLYAQWHVVTYRVWYGFLFFGTLFAISSAARPRGIWPYLLLGVLFFLLFYFELVFATYLSVLCGLFALWQYWGSPKKVAAVYLAQFVGGATALVLLFLQLKAALGLDVVVKDFSITFLARNASAANVSAPSPVDFFHGHNIVFWENFRSGTLLRTFYSFMRSIDTSVFQIWTPSFFIMVAAPFIGIFVSLLERGSNGILVRSSRSNGIVSSQAGRQDNAVDLAVSIVEKLGKTLWSWKFESTTLPGLSISDQTFGWKFFLGALALLSGVGLLVFEVSYPGRLFGVASSGSIPVLAEKLATSSLWVSLAGLLVVQMYSVAANASAWRRTLGYSFVALPVVGLPVVYAVFLLGGLPHPSITSVATRSSLLMIIPIAVSGIGLLLGYFLKAQFTSVICRASLTCSLVAAIIAESPELFDQNYSPIWLSLVQDWKIRLVIRLATLMTIGSAVAVAARGASRSFGRIEIHGLRHVIVFFFLGLASYCVIYILSPGYVWSGYTERLAPFAIFFMSSIPAVAIYGMLAAVGGSSSWLDNSNRRGLRASGRRAVQSGMALAVAVILLFWVNVQVYYARLFPPDHAAFAKTLSSPPFKNASFAVGNYAAVVAYYTGNWAYMDTRLGAAAPDPRDPLNEHLKDKTALWFADWKSNAAYRSPAYYACMKPQTFDSALALRDPVLFGDRFSFCDSEPIVAGQSDFDDRTLASDQPVPRFWAVVQPGSVPPRVVGIDASPARGADGWSINYKLEIIANPERSNLASKVELIASPGAMTCNVSLGATNPVDFHTDGSGFKLPAEFSGMISVRTRTETKKLGWTQDRWIISEPNGGPTNVSHCPQTVIESSFAGQGLKFQFQGWSTPESWGTWSIGESSMLAPIEIRNPQLNSGFLFEADVRSFVSSPDHLQRVRMLANGIVVADWIFTPSNCDERYVRALIPSHLLAKDRMLHISFETPDAVSPASQGASSDTRKLGIGIRRFKIEAWAPPPSSQSYDQVSFQPMEDDGSYLAAGWLPSGGAGVMAQDPMASLLLPVPKGAIGHPTIAIDASLVDQIGQECVIDVFANKKLMGQITAAATAGNSSLDLPDDLGSSGTLLIEFKKAQRLGLAAACAKLNEPLPLLLRNIRVDWIRQ